MARSTSLFKAAVFSLTLSLELAIASFISLARASTVNFNPPDRGVPEMSVGGATRGDGLCGEVEPLSPKDTTQNRDYFPYFGLTVADRPTLFFHVKGSSNYAGQPLYFELSEIDAEGEPGEVVYQTDLSLPDRRSVMSVSLPADLVLEEGKIYQWYIEMTCSPLDAGSAEMNYLEGWIDRIGETPDLSDRLEIARTPTDRATVYAEAGIWFDAIETLARERRVEDTPELKAAWEALLGDSDVGLSDDVVDTSVLD